MGVLKWLSVSALITHPPEVCLSERTCLRHSECSHSFSVNRVETRIQTLLTAFFSTSPLEETLLVLETLQELETHPVPAQIENTTNDNTEIEYIYIPSYLIDTYHWSLWDPEQEEILVNVIWENQTYQRYRGGLLHKLFKTEDLLTIDLWSIKHYNSVTEYLPSIHHNLQVNIHLCSLHETDGECRVLSPGDECRCISTHHRHYLWTVEIQTHTVKAKHR